MNTGDALLAAICKAPDDGVAWLALADWLEEEGDADRAELSRLTHRLRGLSPKATAREETQRRAQEMLLEGVEPCMPQTTNSLGMSLTLLPAGSFRMGAARGEPGRQQGEGPRHVVDITRPFYIGTFSVTQGEYAALIGHNPSQFASGSRRRDKMLKGQDTTRFPVERVTWHDAVAFCQRLSERPEEKKARRAYRLPTEAEWEYACRAGTTSIFFSSDSFTSTQANFDGKYPLRAHAGPYLGRTCRVGSYRPNLWGLYDMTGNVWQWCADWYDTQYYTRTRVADPRGPATGERRCRRGGSWYMNATQCRSAYRSSNQPDQAVEYCGFRVVMTEAVPAK
jgi:uncharacterized protein (TIGR02996 family)